MRTVTVIGGGLAGSEAAWQAASRGVPVVLHEMRPVKPTAVHKTDGLAELVCSNSFRGDKLDNAVGLLKEEMRRLGSLVMRCGRRGARAGGRRARRRSRRLLVARDRGDRVASADQHPPRRSHVDPRIGRRGARRHRHRPADVRRAVGRHRRARRREASVLLRRDQPDRPGGVDRPLEGLPRLTLGPELPRRCSSRPAPPGRRQCRKRGQSPIFRKKRRPADALPACGVDDGEGRLSELPVHQRGISSGSTTR